MDKKYVSKNNFKSQAFVDCSLQSTNLKLKINSTIKQAKIFAALHFEGPDSYFDSRTLWEANVERLWWAKQFLTNVWDFQEP